MKLLTEEIRKKLPPLYSQENVKDPIVQVKFFTPWTNWTWYAYEFDGKDIFFGYVVGFEKEIGYFSLSEMESIRGPAGLTIERDMYFRPKPLSEVYAAHGEKWLMSCVRPLLSKKGKMPSTTPTQESAIQPGYGYHVEYAGNMTGEFRRATKEVPVKIVELRYRGRADDVLILLEDGKYGITTIHSLKPSPEEPSVTKRLSQTNPDFLPIEKGLQFWNKVTATQKAIMQNVGAKRILNIHDNGDVIFEANDGKSCVLTTDGDLFIGTPRMEGNGNKSIELLPASISPEDRRLLSWVNEPLPPEAY